MSVDLWIDKVASHARIVLVRILGGYDWWRYGCDRLSAVARERGIKLALLPGECRDRDERLIAHSTLPEAELEALLGYFREGGPANMRALVRRLAGHAGSDIAQAAAKPLPKVGFYDPPHCEERVSGAVSLSPLRGRWREAPGGQRSSARRKEGVAAGRNDPTRPLRGHPPYKGEGKAPVIPILFYRSMLLAADVAPIDALARSAEHAKA